MSKNQKSKLSPLLSQLIKRNLGPKGPKSQKSPKFTNLLLYCYRTIELKKSLNTNDPPSQTILNEIKKQLFNVNRTVEAINLRKQFGSLTNLRSFDEKTLSRILRVFEGLSDHLQKNTTESEDQISNEEQMLNNLKTTNDSPWTNTDEEVFQKKRPNMFSGKPNLKDQIPEKELLRDLLYVLQGIEGKHIKYNLETDSYLVPFIYGVSLQKRNLISRISELGWLHQHIITFLYKSDQVGNSVGLVTSVFCSSIRNEMKNYYKFITKLISKISPKKSINKNKSQSNKKNNNNDKKNNNKNKNKKFFQGKLTLFKLFSQIQSPLRKFRVLASICDTAETVKGGALINVLYDCLSHGDNEIRQMVGQILSKSWQPIFRIAKKWIRIGELNDPFKEFFVVSDPNVPKEHLWQKKYQLKKEMIPKFIEMNLANKILRIGKSINFIQECCRLQEEENNSVSILLQNLASKEGKENINEVENFISNGLLINPIMSDEEEDDENSDGDGSESSGNDFQDSDSDFYPKNGNGNKNKNKKKNKKIIQNKKRKKN